MDLKVVDFVFKSARNGKKKKKEKLKLLILRVNPAEYKEWLNPTPT